MNRLWAPVLLAILSFAPFLARAQSNIPLLDPEWQLVPEACSEVCPCGMAGVMQVIQNGMNAAISFGIIICVAVIAFAGILLILTPTNPESHSQAKKIFTNAVIGFLIILSSWLIVDFVMKLLYNPNAAGLGPWNEILVGGNICIVEGDVKPLFTGDILAIPGQGTVEVGSGGQPSGSGGVCSVQSSGACAVSALSSYFGAASSQASQVCYGESSGNIASVSRTDIMRNDPGRRAFSFGLFQINITQHPVGGFDCPSAFRGRNYTARVTNETLYRNCVNAAKNPTINKQTAQRIYTNRGSWADWSAARVCRLVEAPGVPLARAVSSSL